MLSHLNFLDTTIALDVAPEAAADFEPVRRFFRHLLDENPRNAPAFRVSVVPLRTAGPLPQGRQVTIRRSTAPEFTFEAVLSRHRERWCYAGQHTRLDTPADATADPRFEAAVTAESAIQVIDFLRDLVIRREETLGTVLLHAAAVRRGGQVFAIAGPKGSGKTTTLLSVLQRAGWEYFSGDKLFCRPDADGITVYAWRDYPYVGVGTLLAHPGLAERVRKSVDPGLDGRALHDKILLDPDQFEAWLGAEFSAKPHTLEGLLLPQVAPGEPLAVERVSEPNARWSVLNTLVDRSVDTTFFGWQHYLVPDYAAFYATLSALRPRLDGLKVLRLAGTLDIDLDEILRGES